MPEDFEPNEIQNHGFCVVHAATAKTAKLPWDDTSNNSHTWIVMIVRPSD